MQTRSLLSAIGLVVLLMVGLAVVYLPQIFAAFSAPQRLSTTDELVYITDLDFWQRTPRERAVVAKAHFDLNHDLNDVPLIVGAWQGV
ncbi:MAG: hypothetical protein ACK47M_02700, partial [Caldilinea sp.]